MADMDVRLGQIEEWRKSKIDPALGDLEKRTDSLEQDRDTLKGSLRVIIWLNGVIIAMIISTILALFTWGLGHITAHLT